jgi:hypothetical protein
VLSGKHSCSLANISLHGLYTASVCYCLSLSHSLSRIPTGSVGGAKGAAAPPPTNRSCGCKTTRRRFIKLCSMPTVCQFCCQPPHLSFCSIQLGNSNRTPAREKREAPREVRLEVRERERPPIISRSAFNQLNSRTSHAPNLPL